jgi:nucleotide-binding universal stress UspA family protein
MATLIAPARVAIKNILLATDFSSCSDTALPYAAGLARRYDSTLFVLNVVPGIFDVLPADPRQPAAQATGNLQKLAGSGLLQGVRHQEFIGRGDTAAALSEFVRQNHIDLIVLGTHGRKGIGRLLLGSVAEEIFRNSPCPVLTVGPQVDTANAGKLRHIIFATDFGKETRHGLPHAISIAEENEAAITLVHVAHGPDQEATEELEEMVPAETLLRNKPDLVVKRGDPAESIVTAARELGADLIVIGVHRPIAFGTHGARGVAYKVVCEAPCPVMTVGPEVEN